MKVKIKDNIKELKTIFKTFKFIGYESKMVFTQEGLTMCASSSNTIGAKVVIKKEFFEEYEVTDKEEFGIILDDVRKALLTAKTETTIRDMDNRIEIKNDKDEFLIPILNDVEALGDLPTIEYEYEKVVNVLDIVASVKKVASIGSEQATLCVKDGKLIMKGVNGLREAKAELIDSEPTMESVDLILTNLKAFDNLEGDVKINMKGDHPLTIKIDEENYNMVIMISPLVGKH